MNTILKLFRKKEEYIYAEEEAVFKHCFRRYFIKHIGKEEKEFWAHSTTEELRQGEKLSYFIGSFKKEKLTMALNFRTLPYDVQKGGGRLIRIYLHNDWTEV